MSGNGPVTPSRADVPTVAVIADDDTAGQVKAAVNGTVRLHRSPTGPSDQGIDHAGVVAELTAEGAVAACIGGDVSLSDALALAETIDRERPETSVILLATPTPDLWRDVIRSGVRDVVDPGRLDADLPPAVARAAERGTSIAEHLAPPATEPETTSRVIMVLSAKGGSGKTMVSSNLAAAMAAQLDDPVALVDLDVQFGDVASALGIVPEHTITDLASTTVVDATTLKVFLTPHPPSGAFVLCGAESPEDADALTAERAAQVVDVLAQHFACVVVDTAAGVDDRMLAVLECATDVVLVVSMDVSSIRNLSKEMTALERAGLLPETRHLVLNRADDRLGLAAADVEAALGMKIDVSLPASRAVPMSMNRGRPIVVDEPDSPVGRELVALARRLTGAAAADDDGRSWFGGRRRQR